MFQLEIDTDNDAFTFPGGSDTNYEVARILRHLADQMEDAPADTMFNLRGLNGNRVGQAEFVND